MNRKITLDIYDLDFLLIAVSNREVMNSYQGEVLVSASRLLAAVKGQVRDYEQAANWSETRTVTL